MFRWPEDVTAMAQGFFGGQWKWSTMDRVMVAQPYEYTKPPNCKLKRVNCMVCESYLNKTAVLTNPLHLLPPHPQPLLVDSGLAEFPDSCHYKVCLLGFLQRGSRGHRVPFYMEASEGWSLRDGLKLTACRPPQTSFYTP